MDIKLPLDAKLVMALNKSSAPLAELKLNQVLDAKIITNQVMLNTLTVSVADKTMTLQSQQALALPPGQTLQLQVVKLLPTPELKIIAPPPSQTPNTSNSAPPEAQLLKLLPSPTTPAPATAPLASNPLATLNPGDHVQAQILNIGKHTLTVQLTPEPSDAKQTQSTALPGGESRAVLDSKQLQWSDPAAKSTLTVGSRIDLQILKSGERPVLSASLPAPSIDEQIATVFKQLLPVQVPPQQFLAQLAPLIKPAESDKAVGQLLKQLAHEILQHIPDKTKLFEPATLKQAIAQSGLFMERNLVEAEAKPASFVLPDDFKLKLSKLIAQLGLELAVPKDENAAQQTASELLKETLQKAQGNLAKLTLDQLNSLPRDDSPKQVWMLELPFFNKAEPETLQLIVEQDKQANSENGQKNWVVSITITPPELATIHCKVSCYDGSINTRFWSESTSTVDKINARLDYLRQQFEQKGLIPGFMDVQQGKPSQTHPQTLPPQSLLSEKV
ncbi:flagellar hook-length control protein FliK [Methylomonas sp. LW13]|uniref:flagellar hook-length control protein FliK n=1 Tax=unclassified Methylomonas TaxID=2608980 RepID=UPI00051AE6D1|nr:MULTISPECIES: flagellar hook-length control protein FliK [unclassified Methylomonas]PKD40838.1 flagellar hook-length control protein FliK [Methylomonas sp. Kb3]QBC27451.1 flagellar hook-length control protein FliK [Methylomonas sp. LW13]